MVPWVQEIIDTSPENLTEIMLMTIECNGFVRHNYFVRWNWSNEKRKVRNDVTNNFTGKFKTAHG